MTKITQQQRTDQLTSRSVKIPLSKTSENSADEILVESDMDMTILDVDTLPERFLSKTGQNQVMVNPLVDTGEELERNLSHSLRHGTPPPTLEITPTMTKLMFGLSRSLENVSSDQISERIKTRSDLGLGYKNNEFY